MAKSERLFEMLQYIRECPHLTAQDLARLCNVSERGVYRYLNTLYRAGIPVQFQVDGYKLPEDGLDLLKRFDIEHLQALKVLLSIGMQNSDDASLLGFGTNFIQLIDENLPKTRGRISSEIDIIPKGIKASNYGGAITIGHSSRPDIINPILTSETISANLMNLIFSSLLEFDSKGRPVPDLAKSWEVSKDGLVWTFFLREDVKFHDGHPLTAHDVEFTYGAIMDPNNKSPKAERYELVDGIETEGDYTFRIVLKHPFSPFVHRLNREIAPRHILEGKDLRRTSFNRHPVGSGPFKFVDWTADDTMILDANREYYHEGRPVLNRLIFKAYPNRDVALQAIARGEMDIGLNLAASDLLFVSRHGGFRIYSARDSSYYALMLNLRSPLFSDIRVRKALDYAIDKELIVNNQLKGHSEVCTGPFSVDSWAYNPEVKPNSYSIEKARELLAQAGWEDTDGDSVLDKDGKLFEIPLTVPDISDSLERVAVAIKAQLMRVGIRMKIIYISGPKPNRAKSQAILAKFAAGADPDTAYKFWHSEGQDTNMAYYENRFVDHLLELGRQTADFEGRKEIYYKIHELIHDDYPAIFLASGCEFIGSSYRFENAKFSSLVHFLSTVKDWQIITGRKEDAIYKSQQKLGIVS